MASESKQWIVYGLIVNSELVYVGMTANKTQRLKAHKANKFHGQDPKMIVIERVDLEKTARKREREIIEVLRPARNEELDRKKTVELYEYERQVGLDETVPATLRVYEGMLHPDEAESIWFNSPHLANVEILNLMPGWTLQKAIQVFGNR